MKWLLLAIAVLVVGGAWWVRTARQGPGDAHRPHRLDDSMSTRETGVVPDPDAPNPAGPQGADSPESDRA